MRILHLRAHGPSGPIRLPSVGTTQGLLCAIPLRLHGSFSMSLLFEDRNSLSTFLQNLRDSPGRDCEAREFDVPGENTIQQPLIILGAPRSGSTLLFEVLSRSVDLWTIGGESHEVIEPRRGLPGEDGNRLAADDADPATRRRVKAAFLSAVRNRGHQLYLDQDVRTRDQQIRLLEKTPKNSLRVPYLRAIFPDCRFIFLYREPLSNIGSLIDGWNTPHRFNSYRLGDTQWKFLLPPGWRGLIGRPTPEIAAAQWRAANTYILKDLALVPRRHWHFVDYNDLVADPGLEARKIREFAFLRTDEVPEERPGQPLPLSSSTLTPPSPEKWRRHAEVLDRLTPGLRDVVSQVSRIRAT